MPNYRIVIALIAVLGISVGIPNRDPARASRVLLESDAVARPGSPGPIVLTVQLRMLDASGNPVNSGSTPVRVRIYNQATGGNVLHDETILTSVTNGLSVLEIGRQPGSQLNPSIFSGSPSLYLGIQVLPDANEMIPRLRLTHVPFAAVAETALNASSAPAGSIMMFAGTTPPAGWLLCDGSAVSQATYASLFQQIGDAYTPSPNGTTFNLPDLQQRFPLGKGLATPGAALGEQGGSLSHDHSIGPHTHTIDAHAHNMAHTHPLPPISHSIPAHDHGMSHNHQLPAHSHGFSLTANSAGDHRHGVLARDNNAAIGSTSNRCLGASGTPGVGMNRTYDFSLTPPGGTTLDGAHVHSISGSVGNVGSGNNGDTALTSGPSSISRTSSEALTTDTFNGSTLGSSQTTTSSTSLTTNLGGAGSTSSVSTLPPYVTVNFIIKT